MEDIPSVDTVQDFYDYLDDELAGKKMSSLMRQVLVWAFRQGLYIGSQRSEIEK